MYKPFNLDEALAGKPVVTRDGRPVKIAGYNDYYNSLLGWINGDVSQWTGGGKSFKIDSTYDLFMAPTTRKEWVVRMVHKVQKHIAYCSSPKESYEVAEHFSLLNNKWFDCSIHEITITE